MGFDVTVAGNLGPRDASEVLMRSVLVPFLELHYPEAVMMNSCPIVAFHQNSTH